MTKEQIEKAIKSLLRMAVNYADEYSIVLDDDEWELLEFYKALDNPHTKRELEYLRESHRLSKTENKNGT